jgi:hypothetical protein
MTGRFGFHATAASHRWRLEVRMLLLDACWSVTGGDPAVLW